jgi:hypothetical protein
MNERLKELALQAEQYAQDDLIERRTVGAPLYAEGEYDSIIKQKFAELIVQNCIDYCGENLSTTVGGALKIHFGVE